MATAKTANKAKRNHAETRSSDEHSVSSNVPTKEEIERRAYEIYLARGSVDGYDQGDWLQVECELKETQS